MQSEIWQVYQSPAFQLLGVDVMPSGANGVSLAQFRINAGGLTFPLWRDCADGSALSDTNLIKTYNQRDNYVVIDGNGIIRYHADDAWDYGFRYHLDELQPAIDAALLGIVSVPPRADGPFTLAVSPNPFTGHIVLTLANPAAGGAPTRFRVLDIAGRQVAAFSPAAHDTRVSWDARAADGRALAPGLYLVQAESGAQRLTRRIVLTR